MTRLLMLGAGVGAGHNRAAEALQAACARFFPSVESDWLDSLKFTNRWFRTAYADSYLFMANYSPGLWGFLYKTMGKPVGRERVQQMVQAYDKLAYRKLWKEIDRRAPDAIVATHFLPVNVVTAKRGGRPIPAFVVVTDFDVHAFWVNRRADGYFVPSEEIRRQLEGYRYPAEKIRVTGIPVHPAFSDPGDPAALRKQAGFPPGRPTVVFMSGGFGVGDMDDAVDRLLSIPVAFNLIVICGRNESMARKLAARRSPEGKKLHALGFVKNVHDYLEAADLVITKAGGLSVSECLARRAPMVVYRPIPGQEERNCDYLLEQGAAVKAKGIELIDYKVQEILQDPPRLARMRERAAAIARPHAAREIVNALLAHLENRGKTP